MYTVWPTVFACRSCGQIHYYRDLQKLLQVNDRLACKTCKGHDQLRQVPYAFVCECGRIDLIFIKHEQGHPITLVNKGSFQELYWWCKTCRKPLYRSARDGLGYRPCSCLPRKLMRGILLEDSRVYYSQSIDLVEIEPDVLNKWKDNTCFSDILLGAILQIPAYDPIHLRDLAKWKPSEIDLTPELKVMRTLLLQRGMSEVEADTMVQESAKAGADPWVTYDRDLAPFRSITSPYQWEDSRRTREYIFVRDEPSSVTLSLENLISEASKLGDSVSTQRLESERAIAAQLGLVDLRVVQALPILLAGIGYIATMRALVILEIKK